MEKMTCGVETRCVPTLAVHHHDDHFSWVAFISVAIKAYFVIIPGRLLLILAWYGIRRDNIPYC